ncbi:MAG: DUF86 domain-containing protein [Alphaproteobacteria bacterium]|nr:DUF86 domain-containing protein [Alphaproteobacteria bacterium]
MTIKDWRVRLADMVEAVERVRRYIKGMDRDAFCEDERTQDAVARNLEIMGEAVRGLPQEVTQRYPDVPWSKLSEMRNILVHEYHAVASELLWRTLLNDILPLEARLRAILNAEDKGHE